MGCSTVSDNYEPEEVNLPKDTAKVAAGHYHSLAINGDGERWSWGYVYNALAMYTSAKAHPTAQISSAAVNVVFSQAKC